MIRYEQPRLLKSSGLYGNYWFPDVFNKLGNLKAQRMGENQNLNEVSKKQRTVYEALGIRVPTNEAVKSLVTKS